MIEHRSNEWYKARIGVFTASNFSRLMARPADKESTWSKSALNFIEKSASQIVYNDYLERPDSDSTRWGIRNERIALETFCSHYDFRFEDIGFILSSFSKWIGATPDAKLISHTNPNKMIVGEVKCPHNPKNFFNLKTKVSDWKSLKKSKSEYYWQIQGTIWVTNADFAYLILFDPRENFPNSLHTVLIERNQEDITLLQNKVNDCIIYRDQILEKIRSGDRRAIPLSNFW